MLAPSFLDLVALLLQIRSVDTCADSQLTNRLICYTGEYIYPVRDNARTVGVTEAITRRAPFMYKHLFELGYQKLTPRNQPVHIRQGLSYLARQ